MKTRLENGFGLLKAKAKPKGGSQKKKRKPIRRALPGLDGEDPVLSTCGTIVPKRRAPRMT